MVVDELYVVGVAVNLAADEAPWLVDAEAVKTVPIAAERLQPVSRRRTQVEKVVRAVEDVKFAQGTLTNVGREPPGAAGGPAMEQIGGAGSAEGDDLACTVSLPGYRVNRYLACRSPSPAGPGGGRFCPDALAPLLLVYLGRPLHPLPFAPAT